MQKTAQIICYDFNNLFYSSFYLAGLIQNAEKFGYRFSISRKVPRILLDPAMTGEWRSLLFSVCLFEARLPEGSFFFCIDTRDSAERLPEKGNGYHLPLLENVKFYFKVNYNKEAIACDSILKTSSDKIVPVMPFMPVQCPNPLALLPRITPCPETGWTTGDAVKRIKALCRLPSMQHMKQLRSQRKDKDIFLVLRFYHEPEHNAENEFRYRIIKEVRKLRPGSSLAGFTGNRTLPGKFAEFQMKEYILKDYLRQAAGARLAIYVRGMFNCISFKFGQMLSMGLPAVGQPVLNNRTNIMTNPFFDSQFAFDNPEEIAGKAAELLGRPEDLKAIGASNARVFDEKFTPEAAVAGMLKHMKINAEAYDHQNMKQ